MIRYFSFVLFLVLYLLSSRAFAANCKLLGEGCDEGTAYTACQSTLESSVAYAQSGGYTGAVISACTPQTDTSGQKYFRCQVQRSWQATCWDPNANYSGQEFFWYAGTCLDRPEVVDRWMPREFVCHQGCKYAGYTDPVTGSNFFATVLDSNPLGTCVAGSSDAPPPEDCPTSGCPPPDDDGGGCTGNKVDPDEDGVCACPEGMTDPDGDNTCTTPGGTCPGNKVDPLGTGSCACPSGTSDPDGDNTCTSTGGGGDDDGNGGTCDPRTEDCTGAGVVGGNLTGDLYTPDQITADSQISRLVDGVRNAPIAQYATSFFGGCSGGGGGCPSESWTAGLWGYSFDLGIFCAGVLSSLIAFAGWVALTGMALFAFRVALL